MKRKAKSDGKKQEINNLRRKKNSKRNKRA